MIKVICFDLGKVIVDFDYGAVIQEILKWTPVPASEVTGFLSSNSLINDYETGRISTADFYQRVCRGLELDVPLDTFKSLWVSMFLPVPLIAEPFLKTLKERYRLILLSNTNEIHFGFLEERFRILGHIEDRVLSYQVGCMKPEPRIYHIAVAKSGARPEEILFTDDREENIEAARQLGIQAIRFQSEQQLRREMDLLGLAI
jgi:putative hydrolase of the HAD superfamily